MITKEQRELIFNAIRDGEKSYPNGTKYATSLGINPAQLSRLKKGDTDNLVSDSKLISIARRLNVNLSQRVEMVMAKTPVFEFVNMALKNCQQNSMSGLLCDNADIGKTYAAKYYARTNVNAVYIDCSQTKSKQKLIRTLAKEFGLQNTGRYIDVYEDLVFYIKTIHTPLVILDEAGDLDYAAWLELKALWNATEYACGWYMIGADGLKAKIDGNIGRKKVGYTEIFSRYGNRYQRITPAGDNEDKTFAKQQTAIIAKANGITDVQSLYARTQGSLRRIYIEIQKLKTAS